MATCPRCGAQNQPDKSACWKCWAPLPADPPPPSREPESAPIKRTLNIPTPSILHPRRHAATPRPTDDPMPEIGETEPTPDDAAVVEDAPETLQEVVTAPHEPDNSDNPPEITDTTLPVEDAMPEIVADEQPGEEAFPIEETPAMSADELLSAEESDATTETDIDADTASNADDEAPTAEDAESAPDACACPPEPDTPATVIYVAGPTTRTARHGAAWLILTAALLAALLIAALFVGFRAIRGLATRNTPRAAAERYLTALLAHDDGSRQAAATARSRGLMLPPWLRISHAQCDETMRIHGTAADTTVLLRLVPLNDRDELSRSLETALVRPYRVTLVLRREHGDWRVDQAVFFLNLLTRLTRDNPRVRFPVW